MRQSTSDVDSTVNARAHNDQLQSKASWAAQRLQWLGENRHLWIVLPILALLVWILALVGTFHCSFLMLERTDSSSTLTREGLGLFSTSIYDMDDNMLGCVAYGQGDAAMDGPLRAARAFGMMGTLSLSIALILVTLVQLFLEDSPASRDAGTGSVRNASSKTANAILHLQRHRMTLWSVATCLFFGAFLCELMTFVVFGKSICNAEDITCRTGAASILSIGNLLLLPVLPALMYAVPPVATPLFLWNRNAAGKLGQSSRTANPHIPSLEEIDFKFEILSIQPSSALADSVYQGGPVDLDELDDERDNVVVMEGIECVAKDHLNNPTRRTTVRQTWHQQIVQKYFAMGRHPRTRAIVAIGLCMSWVFTIVGVTGCTFMLVGVDGQDRDDLGGLGLFHRAFYKNDDLLGCIAYPPAGNTQFDGPFQVGRAFGIVTLVLLTTSLASFVVLHGFIKSSPRKNIIWWITTQLTLPVALVSQLVTFASFETQSCTHSERMDCVPGRAGVFAVLSAILLLPLTVMIFFVPCPKAPLFRVRPTPPKLRSQKFVKSQAEAYKHLESQQKHKSDMEETMSPPISSPEPTGGSTEEGSDTDSSSIQQQPISCKTVVEEGDGKRTIRKEVLHADGSTTITTTVEECGYICSIGKPQCFGGTKVKDQPPTSKKHISPQQSTEGKDNSCSCDSRTTVDHFEAAGVDTSNDSSCNSTANIQHESHYFAEKANTRIVARTVYEFESTATYDTNMYTKSASSMESTIIGRQSEDDDESSFSVESCSSSDDGITFDTGNANYKDQRREGTTQEYCS